jgi:flagellar basal body-associated protein FliL
MKMNQEFGAPLEEPKKKRNTTTIVIIVVVLLLICCCLAGVVYVAWNYGDTILRQLQQMGY